MDGDEGRTVTIGAFTAVLPPTLPPGTSFTAPFSLASYWPSFAPYFDDSDFEWIYVEVNRSDYDSCAPMSPISTLGAHPTYLVLGLVPYVAFQVTLENDSPQSEAELWQVRIRYWAGVMNNFSVFHASDTMSVPYTSADFDSLAWSDAGTGGVIDRGEMARLFTSYTQSMTFSIGWTDPSLGTVTQHSAYPCTNPSPNLYGAPGGGPSSLAFSDRSAWTAASSSTSGDMTSFLGTSVWGEVCLVRPKLGFDRESLIREGFHLLFGDEVRLQAELQYFDTSGAGMDGPGAVPHTVQLRWCLHARDLQDATWLARTYQSKRTVSPAKETNWLYRDFDPARLQAAVEKAFDEATDCPCEVRLSSTFSRGSSSHVEGYGARTVGSPALDWSTAPLAGSGWRCDGGL